MLSQTKMSNDQHEYKKLSSEPGIVRHGDLEGAAICIEGTKKCFISIKDCVNHCCANLCMSCEKCCAVLGECVDGFRKILIVNGYNLLIRPVGNGIGEFFRAPNGELRWYQPGIDLTAGVVGNPMMTLLIDPFMALDKEDKMRFWPLANPAGRFIDFFQFLIRAAHGVDTKKNLGAAGAILTLSTYFALLAANVANTFCEDGFSLDTTKNIFTHPASTLNPMMGWKAIQNLMQGDPTLWQQIIIPLSVYFGLTKGSEGGKALADFDFTGWNKKFKENVAKDSLDRHLDELAEYDETTAREAHALYEASIKQGKNWKVVDVIGRRFEGLLKLPAHIFQAPSRNLWDVTGAKAWLKFQGMLPSKKELKENAKAKASACATKFLNCMGRKTTYKPAIVETKDEKKIPDFPSFEEIMKRRRNEFGRLSAAGNRAIGFITRDKICDGRNTALNRELEASYIQDVINSRLCQEDFVPTLVLPSEAPPPYNPTWADTAASHPHIIPLLKGEFPNQHATAAEKAKLYQASLYAVYTGQAEHVKNIIASQPPAYATLSIQSDVSVPVITTTAPLLQDMPSSPKKAP